MNLYEISGASVAAAAGAAYLEIAASGRPMNILELGVFLNAATASSVMLGRPANTPAGGTIQTATLPINRPVDAVASGGGLVLGGWTTAPTAPVAGNQLRRIGLPNVVGAGVVWSWNPGELVVGTIRSNSLVLWNFGGAAGSVLNVYLKFLE